MRQAGQHQETWMCKSVTAEGRLSAQRKESTDHGHLNQMGQSRATVPEDEQTGFTFKGWVAPRTNRK